ncbi:hypothetical protein [Roseibium sp. RKSG952]|uniref:hypothetical protein n=1 Tax=Roseibium sp. RKSG952 TaxID=2529384 RepID=UPI0012BB9D19|nr:hypothetical protein [Roseibium sp. RKSG952]MTH98271.1 hypothetical protein [Roseibium sp. RKSG952]
MIRVIALGVWMPLATIMSGLITVNWLNEEKPAETANAIGGLDYENVQPVNVPMIKDGVLQGYVVAKLVFTADGDALRSLPVPPHPFLIDEAFRRLYADETLDFSYLGRYDLDSLTVDLRDATNRRLGKKVVHEVLVEEFNYFPKDVVITH